MEFSIEKLLFKPIAALAIILIFLWFIVNILGWIERKFLKSSYFPYKKKQFFFRGTERKFYDALVEAVGPEFMVFSKCRVVDLVDVDFQKHFRAFNRIKSLSVDFVLVRKGNEAIACVIKLSEDLHEQFDKENIFLDEIFATVELPLIRFETREVYSVVEIQKALITSL